MLTENIKITVKNLPNYIISVVVEYENEKPQELQFYWLDWVKKPSFTKGRILQLFYMKTDYDNHIGEISVKVNKCVFDAGTEFFNKK